MSSRLSRKKHTLDSDEEDDKEDSPARDQDVEGEEEGGVVAEEAGKFTPFHMKDEMEEGYFDKNGTYIPNKEKDEIRDQWMDDIDWVKVKSMEKIIAAKKSKKDKEEIEEEFNEGDLLKKMNCILQAKETVTGAMKRLGKSASGASRWKNKKVKLDESEDDKGNKIQLDDLISCADKLLSNGNLSIYQYTFEDVQQKIKEMSEKKEVIAADSLDMFGEAESTPQASKDTKSSGDQKLPEDDTQWEFRWENKEDAEVYGPYSSQQMLSWKEEGYFKDGAFVKKTSSKETVFYNSNRIDFDLYV